MWPRHEGTSEIRLYKWVKKQAVIKIVFISLVNRPSRNGRAVLKVKSASNERRSDKEEDCFHLVFWGFPPCRKAGWFPGAKPVNRLQKVKSAFNKRCFDKEEDCFHLVFWGFPPCRKAGWFPGAKPVNRLQKVKSAFNKRCFDKEEDCFHLVFWGFPLCRKAERFFYF